MALTIDFGTGWDRKTRNEIEGALRACIGEPPQSEEWVVSLRAGFSRYCDVKIATPSQRRSRLSFEDPAHLPKAITEWIELYPLQ